MANNAIRNPPDDIALSPDGELLVVVDESALMAWNLSSKKQILNMDSWDQIKWYQCVDISNDGKLVAVVASLDEDSKYNMDSDTFSESFGVLDNDIGPNYGNVVFIYDVKDVKTNEYKEIFFDFIIRLGRALESLQSNLI